LTFRWLLRVCAVATVAPLWCARMLPFADMPEQVAVIATLRHLWDPAWPARGVFELALGKSQYVLYHAVGAVLAAVVGSAELGNRILLTLVGLAFPFAFRSLLRALERDERLALFGAPLFWSRPLTMGFLPYVASVPAVAWALALAVRQAREPRRGRAFALAAIALGLFYLHVDAYVLFVVAAIALRGGFGAARVHEEEPQAWRREAARGARELVWLVPSAALAVVWLARGGAAAGGGSLDEPGQIHYRPLEQLIAEYPTWSHDIWRSHVDEACAIALWIAFGVLLVQRGPRKDGVLSRIAFVPLACAALVYFALPYSVGAGVMLNVRIAVFVTLFAPLLIEPLPGWRSAVPLAAVAIASLGTAANAAFEVRRVEREDLGAIDRLIDRMEPGKRVLTLPFHLTSPRTHWAPWTFLGSYHYARTGGLAAYSFSELPHWPTRFRAGQEPPHKPTLFWTFDACQFRNATDGAFFDYVLARGNVDPFRDAPPGPRWRRVDAEREFVLYAKEPGDESPAWTVDDRGPCESRRSLESLP